ncbi:biotin-dependent carboxyltransferase family protein [Dokdonia sinensis]|uniref:Biotin-dependent carboxyltransferase family protein n=1 Tax=Dokdonia sinensis TaxID=2479847 RepID=A0A3M0G404_9FLAO|nr:biotin-dependent carboxyltransferase family protein [Dokdonia sinensis]RMB56922.1 biotin-dependent carboxyltransferase family protein [Dokdonia sinensis]
MSGAITILQPGIYTTVQDEGRRGYAHLGVPESGAIDKRAMRLGNQLMNNPEGSAVLEITLVGPTIRFESGTHFVLTGSQVTAFLDEVAIDVGETAFAKANQILSIKKIHPGIRTYLCIAGGLQTEKVLNSRSYYAPLTQATVVKNQQITLGKSNYGTSKFTKVRSQKAVTGLKIGVATIPVFRGPEYEALTTAQREELLNTIFSISKNWNRMAIQILEPLDNKLKAIRTSPVLPGTVQLTPSGTQIILCNDCQTTGGYPRILQVSKKGMQLLSQMGAGKSLKWELV